MPKRKHGEESGDGTEEREQDHTLDNPDEVRGDSEQVKLPRVKLSKMGKNNSKRLIIVLEKANLEIIKAGKNFELLNTDDHMGLIRKYKKDPAWCRPDITHQV